MQALQKKLQSKINDYQAKEKLIRDTKSNLFKQLEDTHLSLQELNTLKDTYYKIIIEAQNKNIQTLEAKLAAPPLPTRNNNVAAEPSLPTIHKEVEPVESTPVESTPVESVDMDTKQRGYSDGEDSDGGEPGTTAAPDSSYSV